MHGVSFWNLVVPVVLGKRKLDVPQPPKRLNPVRLTNNATPEGGKTVLGLPIVPKAAPLCRR